MKVPIVAYGSTAIPETVGNTGFVWKEYDPQLIAASMDRIMRDEHLRLSLREMGYRRYTNVFANEKIKARLLALLKNEDLIE